MYKKLLMNNNSIEEILYCISEYCWTNEIRKKTFNSTDYENFIMCD